MRLALTSCNGVSEVTGPAMTDLTLVRLLSEGELAHIPRAHAVLLQPSVQNLEKSLKERKRPPFPSLHRVEHNQAQPPNHETQVGRDLQQFPVLLCRPLLLIVPETTDGNCESKHVNIAGVMAESSVERGSSSPSQGSYYNMKRSKAFRKQPLLSEVIAVRIQHTEA